MHLEPECKDIACDSVQPRHIKHMPCSKRGGEQTPPESDKGPHQEPIGFRLGIFVVGFYPLGPSGKLPFHAGRRHTGPRAPGVRSPGACKSQEVWATSPGHALKRPHELPSIFRRKQAILRMELRSQNLDFVVQTKLSLRIHVLRLFSRDSTSRSRFLCSARS